MEEKYKVLLIEADPALSFIIQNCLSDIAQIVHVASEQDAKQLARKGDWHLVISDIDLPEANNLDITQIVKSTNPNTGILIIAENIKVDYILKAMSYHADDLLFKPIDQTELVSRVKHLAEKAKIKKIKDRKVILAIGAHPDDVEFGCGGTLAKFKAEGSEIHILTLSRGEVGGIVETRQKEAEKAAKLQGAQLYLGSFQDTKIANSLETIQFIESIVQQVKPTHIYTHSFNDSHQDHRNTYLSSVTACRSVNNLYSYLSPSGTVDFRPNIFISIDDYIEDKLKAIAAYTSQSDIRLYLQPQMIMASARYWGRFGNYNLVEPMEVIKEQS